MYLNFFAINTEAGLQLAYLGVAIDTGQRRQRLMWKHIREDVVAK